MSDKKISRKSIITYFLSVLNQRNYTINSSLKIRQA